jgi:hypothetical protein
MIVNMDIVFAPFSGSTNGLAITGETGFMRSVCCIVIFILSVIMVFSSFLGNVASLHIVNKYITKSEENNMVVLAVIVALLCLFINKYSFSKYYGDIYILLPYLINCLILLVAIYAVVFAVCFVLAVIIDGKSKISIESFLAILSVACILATLLYSWIISSNRKLRITAEKIDSLIKLDRILTEESVDGDYIIYCGTKFDDLYYVDNVGNEGIYMKISLHDGFVNCKLLQNGSEVDRVSIGSYVCYGFDSDGYTTVVKSNDSSNAKDNITENEDEWTFWDIFFFIIVCIILGYIKSRN